MDLDLNGRFNPGEPGMGGLRVELDNGKTAVTDPEGRFEFSGLRQDTYHVRLPLNQLNEAVRLTGPSDVAAPLLEGVAAEVNFGVVNFARLVGSVFNDYLLGADGVVSSASMPDLVGLTTPRLRRSCLSLSESGSKC